MLNFAGVTSAWRNSTILNARISQMQKLNTGQKKKDDKIDKLTPESKKNSGENPQNSQMGKKSSTRPTSREDQNVTDKVKSKLKQNSDENTRISEMKNKSSTGSKAKEDQDIIDQITLEYKQNFCEVRVSYQLPLYTNTYMARTKNYICVRTFH